jgi:hypothetical protein
LLACALVLAACGGDGKDSGIEEGGSKSGLVQACGAGDIDPPASLARFPFPHGAVLTKTRREAGATIVEGYVANRSLDEVRDEIKRTLPGAGYELGEGDAEEHEAETEFEGHGVRGHLKLRDDVCEDSVSFGVAVR